MSYNYNPSYKKAEEFINHEEILETLFLCREEQKQCGTDRSDLWRRRGFERAEPPRRQCFDREIPEKVGGDFELARQIKQDFYGNRIVMFAPLYLSNYCVNGCVYRPYHMKTSNIVTERS